MRRGLIIYANCADGLRFSAFINPRRACAERVTEDLVQAIRGKDLALQLQTASNAKHLCKIADTVGWKKLWDHALDHGEACITSLRNLVRVVSYPKHAISSCPLCEASELDVPLPGHIIDIITVVSYVCVCVCVCVCMSAHTLFLQYAQLEV